MRHIVEKLVGNLDDKRRWRDHKARAGALPPSHRAAFEALEAYMLYTGGFSDGNELLTMVEDLLVLFEEAAADGTPVRAVVGEDPVDFAETFLANYTGRSWIDKQRDKLTDAIERAESQS